jgi:hypothetical protein
VDDLVDETIVRSEAQRLGLGVPPPALVAAVDAEVVAREAQLSETFGKEVTLADEVQRAYGMGIERWKREVIQPRVNMQLLLMRVVRLDTRRRSRVKVRVIVLESEERARLLHKKLQSGADFSLLAVQESVDPTAKGGGDLPAIARGDLAWPDVETHLFAGRPGQVLGPLRISQEGKPSWHLYKVIQQIPPWDGTRGELLVRLETDLKETPLDRAEFERWRARMRRDFRVQVLAPDGRPILDLGR